MDMHYPTIQEMDMHVAYMRIIKEIIYLLYIIFQLKSLNC